MRFHSGFAALAVAAITVAGCATAVDPVVRNAPLKLALTESVEGLRQKSDEGNRQAQYALSFLMRTGLRGVQKDALGAEALRARAGETRTTSTAVYMPGVNGKPGTTMIMPISSPGVSDAEARRLDACGAALVLSEPALGAALCGSPEAYIDLLPGGAALREDMMRRVMDGVVRVDPASVTDCENTMELWGDAAFRMATGDQPAAAAAADRIITLCGEDRTSWHARVMRAQIHLDGGEADAAFAVMGPVPRPAPAPIGAFASQVAMAAEAMREDWVGYRRERDALLAASLAALRAEPQTQMVETFPVEGGAVTLFVRPGELFGGLEGLMVGVLTPADERAAPRGFWLTKRDNVLDGQAAWFLDEYRCDGRSTLAHFDARPSDTVVRDHVARRMSGALTPLTTTLESGPGPASACRWPVQVAPGLGDDPAVIAREGQSAEARASSTPLP